MKTFAKALFAICILGCFAFAKTSITSTKETVKIVIDAGHGGKDSGQNIKGIFSCVDDFINDLIVKKKWIVLYCKWLFKLLKVIGYEIDYRSNSHKKYFDVNLLKFTDIKQKKSYLFPHDFLSEKTKIQYNYLEIIFLIFEYIYKNNHLINYNLPDNYISFKKLILNYLSKNQ